MQNFHVGFTVKKYVDYCINKLIEQSNDTLLLTDFDQEQSVFDDKIFFPETIKKCSSTLKKLIINNEGEINSFSYIDSLTNLEEISIGNISTYALEQILELPKINKLSFFIYETIFEKPDLMKKISKLTEINATNSVYEDLLDYDLKINKITNFYIHDFYTLRMFFKLLDQGTTFSNVRISLDDDTESIVKSYEWSNINIFNSISVQSESAAIHQFFMEQLPKLKCKIIELSSFNHSLNERITIDIDKLKDMEHLTSLRIRIYNCYIEKAESIKFLNNLEHLELSFDAPQKVLDCLGQLKKLKSLRLDNNNNRISNLDFLRKMSNLEILNLYLISDKLDSTSSENTLGKLHNLKDLSLRSNIILSLETISKLTNLERLDISTMCIADPSSSISLPSVKQLTIDGLEQCPLLTAFPNLNSLEVMWGADEIESFIEHNLTLKILTLNECSDLDSLSLISTLSNLEQLAIFNSSLTTLRDIEKLTKLFKLTVVENPFLTSVEDIIHLKNLRNVWLFENESLRISWPVSKLLYFDKTITMTDGVIYCEHIPTELTVLAENQVLESWYEELLNHGYESPSAVKVMLLGNGRIGKTQLARRLRGEKYDETISSTHGIEVFDFQAEHNCNIDIQCWDFGGQDVYLGTHSLFIDNRALYLLLWTPESENTDLVECEEIAIRNRPLSYWLAYLKSLAGKNANVLICQSQCDEPSKDQTAPIPQPTPISKVLPLTISAKSDNGLAIFKPNFERAVDFQLSRNGHVWIPNSWLRIVQEIDDLKKQSIDTLPYNEYLELCTESNVHAPKTLVSYLHQSGKVFYREGCFNNQLILNQQWALQGVYLLLHREDAIPNLISMEGKFNQETIERLLWKNLESNEDKLLFIEMMKQCGACFKIDSDCYIAPDALPEFKVSQQRIEQTWQGAQANYHVRLNYDFLHDATMRYLLSKIGNNARSEACYWKYGCCYYDSKHKAKVFFNCYLLTEEQKQKSHDFINYGQPGYIDIQIRASSSTLIEHLIESILKTNHLDAKATVEWLKGESKEEKEKENRVDQELKEPFSNVGKGGLDPNRKPNVYFSYAWGKDENDPKQKVCDEIFNKLKSDKSIQIFRDKDSMNSGDSIEAFEKEIGRADYVFMIISEKSLYQSSHCMNELRLVYERAQNEKQEFVSKVIPVIMDDAKIDNIIDRLKVVKNWTQKRDELDNMISEVGAEAAGAESTNQLQIMRSFINSTANALSWIADLVIDRTPELQATTAISLLKTRIEQSKQ
ncbi:COR domain-containing protein [Vibrio alginolyticus]|uniref:COR domain-containing protein n=1 Tax=Vibrio alginolyticus TaxID=663 RepID=UPI00215B9546|nr:COR domain-containing protein [Vibrio alginolyticus]MCR9487317.1 TIR domain-containing protein [Vibrio alginolyticus]